MTSPFNLVRWVKCEWTILKVWFGTLNPHVKTTAIYAGLVGAVAICIVWPPIILVGFALAAFVLFYLFIYLNVTGQI